MLSGKTEGLPYSLSRWTDLPAAKWPWFQEQLDQGWMVGFDPRTAIPGKWSLDVKDTYGLVFWTKNPTNLLLNADRLKDFPMVIHMTLTGWEEVEKGAPSIIEGMELLQEAAKVFGPHRVTWRFSPVPVVENTVERFATIAQAAEKAGVTEVYLAFLQENDLVPETRPGRTRRELLKHMANSTKLQIRLCNEDRSLGQAPVIPSDRPANFRSLPPNLAYGVCESGHRFSPSNYGIDLPKTEGCGCALAVDPFTINETCTMGCTYCYAADKTLAPKKRNTTRARALPMVK